MKRKLFLVPILCSLILAGCGQGTKEPQAAAQPQVERAANATAGSAAATPAFSDNQSVPASPSASGSAKTDPAVVGNAGEVAASGGEGIVPAELAIPAIGVDAKVLSLGITKQGAMDAPKNGDDVGWFKPGYRPGVPGHSVIAGHVDTKTGPAVFYKLKNLKKGNKIIVRSRDGKERVFKVIGSKAYPYDKAPLDKIFGPSEQPLLNLITCTGLYSKSKGTHQERLVVTAELAS